MPHPPHPRLMPAGRAPVAAVFAVSGLAKVASTTVAAGYVASESLPLDAGPALLLGGFEMV